jgi:hypothetical protein
MRLVEDVIRYATKKDIENKGEFVKKYYRPDLDILTLDEEVRKAQQQVEQQEQQKREEIRKNVYLQIEAYVTSKQKNMCRQFPTMFRNMKHHLQAYQAAQNISITFLVCNRTCSYSRHIPVAILHSQCHQTLPPPLRHRCRTPHYQFRAC